MSIDQSRFDELAAELAALRAQVGPTPAVWTPPPPQYQPLPLSAIAQIRGHAERFRKGYRTIEWRTDRSSGYRREDVAAHVAYTQQIRAALGEVEAQIADGRLKPGDYVFDRAATVAEPDQDPRVRHLYQWTGEYVGRPSRLEDAPRQSNWGGVQAKPGPQVEHYVIVHEGWEELDFAGVEYALPNGDPFPIRYSAGRSCLCHKAGRS